MGGLPRHRPQPVSSASMVLTAGAVPWVRVRATVRVSAAHPEAPLTIDAPRPFLDAIEGNARIAVRGTLGGATFQGAFVLLGGRHKMIVDRALASASGVYDGARATLEIEREIEPALARVIGVATDEKGPDQT